MLCTYNWHAQTNVRSVCAGSARVHAQSSSSSWKEREKKNDVLTPSLVATPLNGPRQIVQRLFMARTCDFFSKQIELRHVPQ